MKIINQSYKLLSNVDKDTIYKQIENAGRICYDSRNKITEDSATLFIRKIIENGHESVLEHISLSVEFETSIGISRNLVRHRICSFSEQSTRYCDFSNELVVVNPNFKSEECYNSWVSCCNMLEVVYKKMECAPQYKRDILPLSTATKIVVTANLREWRHIFKLRLSNKAHPQIIELLLPLFKELYSILPDVFHDIDYSRRFDK